MALEQSIPNLIARAQSAIMVIDAEDDSMKWAELNWEFHASLYQPIKMPHLLSTTEVLHVNVGRNIVLYLDKMGFQKKTQSEHYTILDACKAGDAQTVIQLLTQHRLDASISLENYLLST